jgi:hypothetical protein
MINFIEGTLLISNVLLILFSILYGILIVKKKQKEESDIWIYFVIASALFFLSELADVAISIFSIELGVLKALMRIGFGIVVLFAFLSKYDSIDKKKRKR